MFKFLPYILKTLWRHRSRTILTVSGAAVALFVFCFVGAVQQGMNNLEGRESAKQSLVMFQANKFCPFTSHLPQDYEAKIKKVSGVREVVPIQVFTNNCRASLDVIVFYGVPPQKLQSARDFRLVSGNWPDFEQHQDAAVVGRAVASRRNLKAGDKFSIGDLTIQVAGVFTSHDAAEENYIYTHLDFLQRGKSRDQVGTVTQHEILLDPNVDVTAKSKQIDELFRGGPVLTDTRSKGVFQAKSLGDLAQLISLAHYLGYACVGLVLACRHDDRNVRTRPDKRTCRAANTRSHRTPRVRPGAEREHTAQYCRGTSRCGRRHARAPVESFIRGSRGSDDCFSAVVVAGRHRNRRLGDRRIACRPRAGVARSPYQHCNCTARLKYARSLPPELVLLNDQGVPMEIVASPLLFCEIVPDAANE